MDKNHPPPFDNGPVSGKNKEGDEAVPVEGRKIIFSKKAINHSGIIVQKEISITDLGVQKKNGHVYRLYEVEETETAVEGIKEDKGI